MKNLSFHYLLNIVRFLILLINKCLVAPKSIHCASVLNFLIYFLSFCELGFLFTSDNKLFNNLSFSVSLYDFKIY